jgi:hypothetical protein
MNNSALAATLSVDIEISRVCALCFRGEESLGKPLGKLNYGKEYDDGEDVRNVHFRIGEGVEGEGLRELRCITVGRYGTNKKGVF